MVASIVVNNTDLMIAPHALRLKEKTVFTSICIVINPKFILNILQAESTYLTINLVGTLLWVVDVVQQHLHGYNHLPVDMVHRRVRPNEIKSHMMLYQVAPRSLLSVVYVAA